VKTTTTSFTGHARAVARSMQQAQSWDELRAAADAVWDFPVCACAGELERRDLRQRLDDVLRAQSLRLWGERPQLVGRGDPETGELIAADAA